ncbi:MAG: hypothetical protein ACFFFT_10315 [Candidatus Thorarchaeota archaeon]
MERTKLSLASLLKKVLKLFLIVFSFTFAIALSFGPIIAGIITLLPADASKASYLGYHSTCAFAPFSTIILFGFGFIGITLLMKLRKYFVRKSKKSVPYLENEALIDQY